MPKVLNKYKAGVPHGAVYCGRGSPYGNPFVIGRDGDRDQVCERFEREVLPTLDVSGAPRQGLGVLLRAPAFSPFPDIWDHRAPPPKAITPDQGAIFADATPGAGMPCRWASRRGAYMVVPLVD